MDGGGPMAGRRLARTGPGTRGPTRRGAPDRPLPLHEVVIDDAFWAPRIRTLREVTLPYQYEMLRRTGLRALRHTWRPGDADVPHIFWDSDVAKWIEAASYSLATHPDPHLQAQLDEAIKLLAGAQQPDGYLNTYFTVVHPDQRWTDLQDAHELYCAGHLIEAGVAHAEATGRTDLLDVVRRYADLIDSVFGREPGKKRGYDGHEEIELALVRLYRVTGEERYLRLAEYFLDERGREPYYFDEEEKLRGTPGYFAEHFPQRRRDPRTFREYNQSHRPVREQDQVVGHAVRAMYLYSAMADLAAETGDRSWFEAGERLWQHVTSRRMYVTGGLGSTASIEGFTVDYDLPNVIAYAETCAAVGLVFWMHRMNRVTRDGRYTDVLERALYNGVLSGLGADGRHFFYANPLASGGGVTRRPWFDVACCPPNLARLLGSLGGYVYGSTTDEAVVHLYVAGTATFHLGDVTVRLRVETDYPVDGEVRFTLEPERPVTFGFVVRIPGWCEDAMLAVNGEEVEVAAATDRGYVRLEREWRPGDVVRLALAMPVRRVHAHPRVAADAGCVALARGPLVYCAEEADNGSRLHEVVLPADAGLTTGPAGGLPGAVAVHATARRETEADWDGVLYRSAAPRSEPVELVAVPYHLWANRGAGEMRVWLREDPPAVPPLLPP